MAIAVLCDAHGHSPDAPFDLMLEESLLDKAKWDDYVKERQLTSMAFDRGGIWTMGRHMDI